MLQSYKLELICDKEFSSKTRKIFPFVGLLILSYQGRGQASMFFLLGSLLKSIFAQHISLTDQIEPIPLIQLFFLYFLQYDRNIRTVSQISPHPHTSQLALRLNNKQTYSIFQYLFAINEKLFYLVIKRMKDQQLYNLIKKVVREKKKIPHHSETQSFAERYCEKQLKRKINNTVTRQKMGTLLRNFSRTETYYDLPSLIRDIWQLKYNQLQEKRTKNIRKLQNSQQPEVQHNKIQSKSFSNLKNLRSTIENLYTKNLMEQLQNNGIWKNEVLKNNSSHHMNDIEDSIKKYKQNKDHDQSSQVFKDLQRFLKNEKQFILHQKNLQVQKSRVNTDKNKGMNEYLHKVSSYLQIILEQQHKSKWKRKRSSSFLKLNSPILSKNNNTQNIQNKVHKNSILTTVDSSETAIINARGWQKTLPKKQPQKQKYVIKKPKSSFYKNSQNVKSQIQNKTFGFNEFTNNFTFEARNTATDSTGFLKKQNNSIKQNFTFRRRSIKQKIIKKIDKFIGNIDDETITNKKQNVYYNYQINKLETKMNKLYGRYRRETIADDNQIQDLKKLAQEFTVLNHSKRTPPEDSLNSTEKKLNYEMTGSGNFDSFQSFC